MPPVSSPAAVHHVAGARPFLITASTVGAAGSSSPKQQVLVTFPAPAVSNTTAIPSSGQPNSVKKQATCLPTVQPAKQPYFAAVPAAVTKTHVLAVEPNSKQKEVSGGMLTDPTSKSVVSKIKVEKEVTTEAAPPAPPEQSAVPSTGEPNPCMKQGICLPAGQPTKQPLEPQATVPATVTKTAGVAAVEPNSKQKEISGVLTDPVLKSTVSKIKVEREVPMEAAPSDPLEQSEPELGWCVACKESVEDIAEHLKDKHMKRCRVRACHIEKCDQCLSSLSGLLVVTTSDVEDEDSSEDEDDDDNEKEDGAKLGTMDLDRPCKAEPMVAE
ncbi:hypothetical protein HPB50_022700 [Hyalomma asiaticum]|uniref:Uncharacterized protein n=1 Tax=Hyalomma asiaticum TaxID=266040 RepID=A0ACB7T192_HYAAI|nr:hypothetical protein HPB50_022700 [Hyalomma asiaticum]